MSDTPRKMTVEERVDDLFDRLYGQPREDLDEREMRVITEWLRAAQEEAREEVIHLNDKHCDDRAKFCYAKGFSEARKQAVGIGHAHDRGEPKCWSMENKFRAITPKEGR